VVGGGAAVRSKVGRGHHGNNRTLLVGRGVVTVVGGMAVPMKSEALYETREMRPTNLKKTDENKMNNILHCNKTKNESIELILTIGPLHIDSFLLHKSHFSICSTHRIVRRKRPLTEPL
jgi:hypothetical protein